MYFCLPICVHCTVRPVRYYAICTGDDSTLLWHPRKKNLERTIFTRVFVAHSRCLFSEPSFILFPEISVDVKVFITAWDAFFPRENVLRSSEDREYGGERQSQCARRNPAAPWSSRDVSFEWSSSAATLLLQPLAIEGLRLCAARDIRGYWSEGPLCFWV